MIASCQTALEPLPVSRETCERLTVYAALLRRWQSIMNLVAPATLPDVWERHFRDSLQLLRICPHAKRWVDVGAGAGFPGMVIAIGLAADPAVSVTLIESDSRKCAFLREVARETQAPVIVENSRAEDVLQGFSGVDVVTARAVAPIGRLMELASPLLEDGATGLFPKGRGYQAELTRLTLKSNFQLEIIPSLTDADSAIISVRILSSMSHAPSL